MKIYHNKIYLSIFICPESTKIQYGSHIQ